MDVKERKGYFLIKYKDVLVGLIFNKDAKIIDNLDITINDSFRDSFSITQPGEYEVKEVFVMAFQKADAHAFFLNIDNVNILFTDPGIKFSDRDLDELSNIDILIFAKDEFEIDSDLVKFINKIDPKVLLINSNVEEEQFEKMFSVVVSKLPKKYKVSASDFDADEYKLSIVKIQND